MINNIISLPSNENRSIAAGKQNQQENNSNSNEENNHHRNQITITEFNTNRFKPITKPGYIDQIKKVEITRLLSINANSFKLSNREKINQSITNKTKLVLDRVFITEPNAKWSASNTDIIYYKLMQIDRGLKMINADNKMYYMIDKDY